MVWPVPQGISANKSVLRLATRVLRAFRSRRKSRMELFQAAALGGAGVFGQYSSGHLRCLYFGLVLKSRMSCWAMRRCSRSIQGEWGKFAGFAPRSLGGRFFITLSKVAWAWPPVRSSRRCWRREWSEVVVFLGVGIGSSVDFFCGVG